VDDNERMCFLENQRVDSQFHIPYEGRCGEIPYEVFDSNHFSLPFWHLENNNVYFDIHDSIGAKSKSDKVRETALDVIGTKWGTALRIYTDGSVDINKGAVGCGFYIPAFKIARGFRLPPGISIFSAELTAILLAVEWVEEVKPMDVYVFFLIQ